MATLTTYACGGGSPAGLPDVPDLAYGGGDFLQLLEYQNVVRGYTVHVPSTANAATAAPLLIVLHGAGQDAPGIRQLAGIETLTDGLGWIVVYPDGVELSWAIGTDTRADQRGIDDVGFIRRMIERIRGDLTIDSERVFVAGLSNGALMSHRLGCELASHVRGFASVAGTMLDEQATRCAPSGPVRALFFNGDEDEFFPWGGFIAGDGTVILGVDESVNWWAAQNGCASPTTTALPDAAMDGTTVDLVDYAGCSPGEAVRLFAIHGGGHTWPGRGGIGRTSHDIDGNREILTFFGATLP
jgi:polyhydroxybutyrate depolymerase